MSTSFPSSKLPAQVERLEALISAAGERRGEFFAAPDLRQRKAHRRYPHRETGLEVVDDVPAIHRRTTGSEQIAIDKNVIGDGTHVRSGEDIPFALLIFGLRILQPDTLQHRPARLDG